MSNTKPRSVTETLNSALWKKVLSVLNLGKGSSRKRGLWLLLSSAFLTLRKALYVSLTCL